MSVFVCNLYVWVHMTTCALDFYPCVCREMQTVENLLTMMSSVVQRHKKQLQLRNMCSEERVWKSHLNYSMAQAHLALLYHGLNPLHGGALQHRFIHKIPPTLLHLFCVFLGTIDRLHQLHSLAQGVATITYQY